MLGAWTERGFGACPINDRGDCNSLSLILELLNSSRAVQRAGSAPHQAVCHDALARSHIDSCLTGGQYGHRHFSWRLMPEPAQRRRATKSGSLLIGRCQSHKLRWGPRGTTGQRLSVSFMLFVWPYLSLFVNTDLMMIGCNAWRKFGVSVIVRLACVGQKQTRYISDC